MRSLDERIAEINRRSEKIRKNRKKRRAYLFLSCAPLVLCLSILFFQGKMPVKEVPKGPAENNSWTFFAQMDAHANKTANGAVTVFGPGMIRIHLDRDTVATTSILLLQNHSTNSEGSGDASDSSAITYRIALNRHGVKTKFRLSGNTLEVMTNRQSYTLTDDEVSLLKDVLCIPEISATIRTCIIILAVILLLAIFAVFIFRTRKNSGGRQRQLGKRPRIIILVSVLLSAVLFVPIPYVKGDSLRNHMQYVALTYKIVCWGSSGRTGYQETAWYGFPDNFKSLDTLWSEYIEPRVRTVTATVLQIDNDTVVIQPIKSEGKLLNAEHLNFSKKYLAKIDPAVGSDIDIDYIGDIMETNSIQVLRWKMATDLRHREYSGQWLNPETAKRHFEHHGPAFSTLAITEIYSDCFIARPSVGCFEVKLNGQLSDEWSVGDYVKCTYEKLYFDEENRRMEADMLTIKACDKPNAHIYLEEYIIN
jgi:hypothetical protein